MITIPIGVVVVLAVMLVLGIVARGYFLCSMAYPRTVSYERFEDVISLIVDTAVLSLALTLLLV